MTHSDEELMSLMESPTVSAIMEEVAPSMSGHHTTHRENTSIFSSVSAQVDGAASWRQRTPGGAVAADSCDTRDRACNYGFSRCQTSSPQCLTTPSKPSSSCWAHPGGNLAEIDDDCRPDTAEFRMNEMVAFPTMSAVNLNSLSGKVDPDDAKTHSSDSASCCMSTSGKSRRSAIAQSVQRAPVISHTSDDCRNWTEFSPHSNVIVATKPVEDNSNFHETAPHSTHCLLPMSPKPWTDGPNWKETIAPSGPKPWTDGPNWKETIAPSGPKPWKDGPNWKETIAPSGPKPWKDGPNWKETIGPSVPKPPTDWSHWGTSKAGSVSSTPLTYSSCWSKPITAQTKNIMPTSLKSVDEDWTDKNEETVVQIQNTAVTPKSVHHQDNAFNQDESAPNVEEESISWSPKDAILSSPSTDDGFSQSSHRYGKVLAWAKSSQGANGHLSSSLHKSSCSSQQACLSLSSGEVAGGPSSLLQVLEEQQPQACLSVSPDETPGTSSLPQTPSKTNVMTTTQEQTADCSSSFVPPAANTMTLLLSGSTQRRDLRTFPDTHTTTTTTSPGLFPPTEVPALSRRCLWRQEGQEEERELCVSTSTPALKSASTSRNFLSQLFAAGDSSRNSSHQLMGNVFDGLF
ncbi:uncharacterized protein LOC106012303 [Aplysia californica]|uniref:Uncharacterized protein LOC106012303 n=1 Tax=Aplysia californica TaxID=6500 RepID=A0ABM1A3X7_APLCA|nr:uncharacterized protein LOC106012303 [Aplysia californica]